MPASAAPAPASILVTKLVVWGDSMTQVWPEYLADLTGLPLVYNGKGATTVQDTEQSFDTWIEAHKNDADFPTTGHICWCGHTNLNGPNSQSSLTDYTTIIPALDRMSKLAPPGLFMPIGLTTGPETPWGSTSYRQVIDDLDDATATAINERMRATFPATYAEVRRYLVTDGLRRSRIPATAEDTQNIAFDFPPRSLRTDNGNPSHLNEPGRRVAAARLDDLLRAVGWVPPRSPDRDSDGVNDVDDNCPTVSNPGQAGSSVPGVGAACLDAITISTLDLDMVEGRGGVTFSIALSGPVAITTTVDFDTVGTTATTGDFTRASGRATFPPGEQLAYVRVYVTTDALIEPDEYFNLVLSNPSAPLSVLVGSGLGTIENDDVANPAPTAIRQVPAPDTTGVPVGVTVVTTFSEAITGVTNRRVAITDVASATALTSSVTYNAQDLTVTLDPSADLRSDTRYKVKFSPGIKDASGQPLSAFEWEFLTGPAPTVRGTAPTAGATGVAPSSNVGLLFSENVLRVSTATFVLTDSAGRVVPAVVSRSGTTNKWILNPNDPLARGSVYTATVLGGPQMITDAAGNLSTTYSWTFTTG
ncbi:MAG: Ig-like domain-containing protein [Geodermatophilaceae bacterium]|nr:Ig-like domain-containing protein [Geodermatophilaceae bacterium]